ncbi:MAG: hypothetical protein P1P86_09190 [Bacteroidales bacterium]|nr:hypothetical protein [Bacteroidales bacterium]
MNNKIQSSTGEFDLLKKRIEALEQRITHMENDVASSGHRRTGLFRLELSAEENTLPKKEASQDHSIESRIGEYGMAWMGNIVLLFGILFLSQYLQNNNQEIISLVFGFVSVAFVYLLGHLTRKSLPYMSRLFNYNGHLLLYIQAMRISMFPGSQIINNTLLSHLLVLVVLFSLLYLAYRNSSQLLAVIVWLMAVITAVAEGNTHFMLPLMLGISGSAIWFTIKKDWWTGLYISVFLAYFIYLMWIIGNPIMSKSLEFVNIHQSGHFYLFACALAYSLMALLPESEKVSRSQLNPIIVWNGLGFSFIFTLSVLAFFTEDYYNYFGLIAAFCIIYSIWLQLRETWKSVAAMYAVYSFVAFSISIAGIFHFPLAFLLLSIQSILVVIVALWFRSRFMVIMNSILFLGLLLAYLIMGNILHEINFAFAIVALGTARILNWRKQRLEIRTELIRNIFLSTGAMMVLFSLHQAVPANFVTLSWTFSAMLFFILSLLIRNVKYRWLGIITIVVTVFYLFIVDLSNISLGYRIVALMFIASISLGISIFYSRRMKSRKKEP